MRKLARYWIRFRALPGIMQFGIVLAVLYIAVPLFGSSPK